MFKPLLSKAARRTVAALWDRIGALINDFNPTQRANYFKAAKYAAA
jgi:hypothetical protein